MPDNESEAISTICATIIHFGTEHKDLIALLRTVRYITECGTSVKDLDGFLQIVLVPLIQPTYNPKLASEALCKVLSKLKKEKEDE